jgi:hypothetical protein
MSEQYLSTSRLVNVIQLIALGKQTGVFKVYRGQGPTREQAEIHFLEGRPTYAILGQLVGNAALAVLQNWGECFYVFLEGPLPPREADLYRAEPTGQTGDLTASPPAGYGMRQTSPMPGMTRRQATGHSFFTGPFSGPPGPDPRAASSATTGALPIRRGKEYSPGPATPPPRQDVLHPQFVPRRVASMERVNGLPLDRRERMVLLLIDGRRSVADLVRLTRRDDDEVQAVLVYLMNMGLIE